VDDRTVELVELPDPTKLLRLGSMIKSLLNEVHTMPLDERGRVRLVGIHTRAVAELQAILPEPLRREFRAITTDLRTGSTVSDAELRVAQAQLVGWLEGLFQGVQFAAALHTGGAGQPR